MKIPSLLRCAALGALATLPHLAALAQSAPNAPNPRPLSHPYGRSQPIPDRYIVTFKDEVADPGQEASRLVDQGQGRLHRQYGTALKGFSATLPAPAVLALRRNPRVASVEQDQTVSLQDLQNQATWGLDRIDQADLPLDTQYHWGPTGAGVTAFIVDTGLRADHTEFTGRVRAGAGFVADGNGTNDCHGHGTHVAGTVAGTTWGVAKGATVVPVRVLDCAGNGAWSDVIAGLDWVAANTARPAVANLSLGGSVSSALDAAVAGAVAKGVTVVVAAGNSNVDACTASPAREPSAITVGATMNTDYRAYFSNVGTCLDLFAPGYNITSASYTGPSDSSVKSGTSMAAPHVAGVAALILQGSPAATPAAVTQSILSSAASNRLVGIGAGSPNLLVTTLGASGPALQPATQTVAFRSMTGSASKSGGNWRASASVSVRDIATGAAVANATVAGSFAPGGNASCVTNSSGSCSLSSGPIKNNAGTATTFSGSGINGSLMRYDASQNAVTQIVIPRP